MRQSVGRVDVQAWILVEPNQLEITIWGVPVVERLRRALLTAGIPRDQIEVGPASVIDAREHTLLILRSDYVFDDRLIPALLAAPDTLLVTPALHSTHPEVAAAHVQGLYSQKVLQLLQSRESVKTTTLDDRLQVVSPTDLAPSFTASLRKTDPPFLFSTRTHPLTEIEAHIFAASYKGVTDLVTKWIWPYPARMVTQLLARARVHPNTITVLSWMLVIVATALFSYGWFGLGLVVAWVMTFLDTVDGKLARVTLTSSRVGHVLDHGLDLLHPPFWYLAWARGLPAETLWLAPATLVTVGGYVLGRFIEGIFLLVFKMEIHCWQPIDSYFRTVTARRNPNLILLTASTALGRPDLGLLLVATWTACSLGFHTVRLIQALIQRWRGHPVCVWQEGQSLEEITSISEMHA
jgi:phosphatidylglycerophosphate synthase